MLEYPSFVSLVLLSFLAAASINDFRQREVPNWVNYGLVGLGLGFGLSQSIIASDWQPIVFVGVGALFAFGLASLMFYTGQWGGGDSKLLIGIGAVLGLPFTTSLPFISIDGRLLSFLINLVAVSVVYSIILGAVLAFRNRKQFSATLKKQVESYRMLRRIFLVVCALGLVLILLVQDPMVRFAVVTILGAMLVGLYLSILAKAVEHSCMLKKVSPLKLTEGDWIAKDVVVNGKRIAGPKDLGIAQAQIRQLIALSRKGKVKDVLVKQGIPFAPSFFAAYFITVFVGNLFLMLLQR